MPCCRNGGVHLLVVEQLQQGRAAATDPAVVLNADHQPMVTREVHDRGVPRLDPARVDDGDADALVGQPARRPRPTTAAIEPMPTISTSRAPSRTSTSIVPTRSTASRSSRAAAPLGRRSTVGASSTATHSRSSSRDPGAVARRAQPQAGHDLEDRHVPHAVVAGAVVAGHAGPVEHEGDAAAVQRDVHQHLVEGAVEEGGVDRDDRVQAAHREPGGAGDGVLLGDADVEGALGVRRGEAVEPDGVEHRGGDRRRGPVARRRARPSPRRSSRSRSGPWGCRRRSRRRTGRSGGTGRPRCARRGRSRSPCG